MPESFYVPLSDDGSRWRATGHTTGPWDARFQHGGPPSALLARALERCDARADAMVARVTVELLGPVPVGDLDLRVRVARPGRSVELVEAALSASGRDVARASAWRVRRTDVRAVPGRAAAPPLPPQTAPLHLGDWIGGYLDAVEWRLVAGPGFVEPGPGAAWTRLRYPLVDGEEPSPLQRVLAVADSGNGLSSELDLARWHFINPELTVHVHREAVGEWVCLDAVTTISTGGVGLATSVLSDRLGAVGVGGAVAAGGAAADVSRPAGRVAATIAGQGIRMKMRTLGRTGVKVSPLTLGAMMFGAWGNRDHDDSVKVIHAALDAGINVIDTADVYSAGESEEIVGKALKGRREHVVLATKAHMPMGDDPNQQGNNRRWLVTEVESSLRRLQTDHIDLYQVHRPAPDTDVEETLDALTDLQRAGKIRYFGSSTFPASQIVQAQWAAQRRHSGRFVTEQPPYSLLVRGIETEVLPVCQQYGMGVLPWSPLAGGWLSGRWRRGAETPSSTRAARLPERYDLSLPGNAAKLDAAEAFAQLAEEAGMSLIALAIAFVIRHPGVTSAIIGPRTMEQLESQLPAADLVLADDVLDRIDAIVPPGSNLSPGDAGYRPPSLTDAGLRRR